ncbi:MAG: CapA family protein [Victivallaceae bacterium]
MNLNKLFETGAVEFDIKSDAPCWTLSATGDYGILPQISKYIAESGAENLIRNIKSLTVADVSITNLEIALTEPEEITGKGVRGDRDAFINFHQSVPFAVYSMANNHIRDAGAEALRTTFKRFKAENIRYVGAGLNQAEAEAPLFLQIKGIKLGVLAFAQNENQIADSTTPGAAELLQEKVLTAAKKLVTQCEVPVVIMHEGFEFMDFPRIQFKNLCVKLTELGVKLVIGHHSHVPQGLEVVGQSLIFYSLGNFLFDQPHFAPYPWSRKSFVPVITFKGDTISGIEIRPFTIETSPLEVRPATPDEQAEMLAHLKKNSEIISNGALLKQEMDKFVSNILMPEFFGFLQRHGDQNNGNFSELITKFKKQVTVHKLFADFLELYSDKQAGL